MSPKVRLHSPYTSSVYLIFPGPCVFAYVRSRLSLITQPVHFLDTFLRRIFALIEDY